MENRTVLQWDKDDCAAIGLVKFDLLGLGMLSALHYAVDFVDPEHRHRQDAAGRPGGLRHALPGRRGGRVPGGEPGPDGDPAPAAAAEVLRPGGRGGADPARPDPGRLGAPVHPPRAGQGAADPAAPAAARTRWSGRWACRCSRSSSCRWRSTWPGSTPTGPTSCAGRWAPSGRPSGWSGSSDRLYDGHGGQRHHRRAGRRPVPQALRVRQLRLPGEPRDELRLPGLRQRLVQALPPGRVLRRADQRPADGLLLHPVPGRRRPPARGRGAPAGHQRQRRRGHPGAAGRTRRRGRSAGRQPPPAQWGVGGPVVRLGLSEVRTIGDELAERIEAERDAGGAVPGHARSGPPHRRHRPAAHRRQPGGAGHRRRVRLSRAEPARGAVGGRGGGAGAARPAARH